MFLRILLTLVIAMSTPMIAQADSRDAVIDENRSVLTNTFGNCVRTKWMSGDDPCAPPAPEPEPEPVVEVIPEPEPEPVEMISKEERTVYFGFDSAVVEADEVTKLESLATAVNASKSVNNVRVVGYTDQTGTNSYNLKLSNKRVASVMEVLKPLITVDVSQDQMDLRGAGKAPDSGCKGLASLAERKACKRKERRVEIYLDRTFMELR